MKRVKQGQMLGCVCILIGGYNVYMLSTNTDILSAWYSLCLLAAAALAAISFYNAGRWEKKNGERSD